MTAAPKMLLLQARKPDDVMLAHEHECFADTLGVDQDRLIPHNLCSGPPPIEQAMRYDAVLVGGSGEYSVSKNNLPEQDGYLELLGELVARNKAMFASCFGFHGMVQALGGEVIRDAEHMEVGSFELTLTEHGARDELFGKLPARFWAQEGHSDRAARMPEGLPCLASSALAPFQGLRVPGASIWATQFHPELDFDSSFSRFEYFLTHQGKPEEAEAMRARLRQSPEASSLLRAFHELVFG